MNKKSLLMVPLLVWAVPACKKAGDEAKAPMAAAQPSSAPAQAAPANAAPELDPAMLAVFKPLPEVMGAKETLTDEKVKLGRMLYYEARLSKNQDISCNSCHKLDGFGVDNEPTSPGHKGQRGERNSPTVFNAAGNFVQFWDGRAADVEAQAQGPVTNPIEMALKDDKAAAAVLRSMPEYVTLFSQAFPGEKDPVTLANAAAAIGAFERKLVTPDPWDKFLKGDKAALTAEQKAGLKTFVEVGCTACHNGPYLGGTMYQKLGLVKPYPDTSDLGRYKVTKQDSDKMMFKTPGLRNVAKTAPYFHNGKVATLEEAIKQMGEYQLGRQLTDDQVKSMVAWMDALTGTVDAQFVARPELPPSGKKTPKPDPT